MYPFGKGLARLTPYFLLGIPLLLYVVFAFGPSVMTIIYSFTDMKFLADSSFHFVGWDNYRDVFYSGNSSEYKASIYRSLKFTLLVTVFQNGIALLTAIIINQKLKGDRLYRSVLFMPVVLGVIVVALVWQLMFNPFGGPVNQLYHQFLNYNDGFFGSYSNAFNYIIFVQIWQYLGYSMLIFLAGLQTVPKDLYEAGHIDGTNRWKAFRHITFPLIASSFTVNILLSIIGAMQTFDIIAATTAGGFNTRTMAFDVFIRTTDANAKNMGLPAALSVLQFLLIFTFVIVAVYLLRRREVDH
ncbi:carbohydrate ABC transporter permease [Cohnella abietis]|uniref:Sugar ABC transporter permease n=1 Tax=Cohnella abietis TaxID=2507935 RepID=A0A3T1DBX1_9BACL|nr:sugar ABC transporter permease [Cohnella abietis]BBI35610.1 sugar ABC transporter permease [Cohnella abietis]